MQDDFRLQNLDAGADREQPRADGVELGSGQFRGLQHSGAEGVDEDVGSAVMEQTELIGLEPVATGATGVGKRSANRPCIPFRNLKLRPQSETAVSYR